MSSTDADGYFMPRLCPKCDSSFEDRWYCPTCGIRLVADAPGPRKTAVPEGAKRSSVIRQRIKWQQTTWGKCAIGVLLAQGLFYTLMQLASAVALISGAETEWRNTLFGLLVKQSLEAVSLLAGGMMAGAGQRRALRNGTIVGVYNAFFFLVVGTLVLHEKLNLLMLVGQPLFQVAIAALGGYLGRVIWSPVLPVVSRVEGKAEKEVALGPSVPGGIPLPKPKAKPSPFSGKISWIRVVAGSAVVVIGCLSANAVRDDILAERPGMPKLTVQSQSQAKFVAWEISVLATIFGAAIAGSNTNNGLLQGLVVGLISTIILIGNSFQQSLGSDPPTETLLFTFLGMEPGSSYLLEIVILRAMSVVPLCLAGGWFGSQLLPPVIGPPRKKFIPAPV